MAQELKRVGQVVGKEGKTRERTRFHESQRRVGRDGSFGQYAGGGPAAADDGSDARDRRRRAGQSDADRAAGRGRPSAGRRVPALGQHRQHDDSAAGRVHRGSDARGARSGNRRKTGRPGAGARRGRNLERSDRLGQLDGQQPDRPGAQHRRSRDGRGQRRSCRARSRSTCAAKFCS